MDIFNLNPLHYVSLSDFNSDCWLMSSGAMLDTVQYKQMLEAKRVVICGIKCDRYINSIFDVEKWTKSHSNSISDSNSNKSIWYRDAINLNGYVIMQKVPYKDFKYCNTSVVQVPYFIS